MSGNDNLDTLFTTIGKALKTSSPIEISGAINNFQKNKLPNREEVDKVIQLVADEYSVSVRSIMSSSSSSKTREAKFMVYSLLHIYLGISIRVIARTIFHNWHNSVNRAISYYNKCDPKIKQERDFLEMYKKLETKLNNQ